MTVSKKLLPRIFPTAISTEPSLRAEVETINSGKDVTTAKNIRPM